MKKTPICLLIDDPAPIISVYHEHARSRTTKDGRPLIPTFPNSMLFEFCDVVERRGFKGKFSVVPMPGNKGDIVHGLEGVDQKEIDEWLDAVRTRVAPYLSISPELLTHHKAVDLSTMQALPIREDDWSDTQDRTTLTPYIAHGLMILREAGFSVCGVSSPWSFGINVEREYCHAISKAVFDVTGSRNAWFFLHSLRDCPNAKPWIALEEEGRTLVSIPRTMRDHIWQTIDSTRTDEEYVSEIADKMITADGTAGEIIDVLNLGGYPILGTHWQSLMSNGLGTGLRVLDEVGRRVAEHLSDRVEWISFDDLMKEVLSNRSAYPKPDWL